MDIEIGSENFHQISDLIYFSGISIPDALNVGDSGEYVNVKFSYQKQTGKYGKVRNDLFHSSSMFMFFVLGFERDAVSAWTGV